MIVVFAGLPGTGKSTIARGLAAAIGAVVLDKDAVRATLFPPTHISYTTEQDDFCQRIMLETAAFLLQKNADEIVLLDGRTFSRSYQVAAVQQAAARLGSAVAVIECVCSDATARARLERDTVAGTHPARNRDFSLYKTIQARFEPIPPPKLVVVTDGEIQPIIDQCSAYIRGQ